MNNEQILKIAKESGFAIAKNGLLIGSYQDADLIKFAQAVIANYKDGLVPVASRAWNEFTAEFDYNIDANNSEPLYVLKETK